jgi:hypothetical protein
MPSCVVLLLYNRRKSPLYSLKLRRIFSDRSCHALANSIETNSRPHALPNTKDRTRNHSKTSQNELFVLFYHQPCWSSQLPDIAPLANRAHALMALSIYVEAWNTD